MPQCVERAQACESGCMHLYTYFGVYVYVCSGEAMLSVQPCLHGERDHTARGVCALGVTVAIRDGFSSSVCT